MILSTKHNFIFISTPKTGTHSLYDVLQKEFAGQRYGRYHELILPTGHEKYYKFTTVRNPYARLVSAWNSLFNTTEDYRAIYREHVQSNKFGDFVKWAIKNKNGMNTLPIRAIQVVCPQSMYLKDAEVDAYLQIEHIEEQFNKLPFVVENGEYIEIPHLLKRKHKTWDELKNKRLIKLANEFLEEDFEMLDYEKE